MNSKVDDREELIEMDDKRRLMTSSHVVAVRFQKKHSNLIRRIDELVREHPEFSRLNFEQSEYLTSRNRIERCYKMTRDGFSLLCMCLHGREAQMWKIQFLTAFNELERLAIDSPSPSLQSLHDAVKKAEIDKDCASVFGRGLSKYRKLKKLNEDNVKNAVSELQCSLF